VGHVDHAEQAEGDRQAQGCQQQDRTQQAAERLAEDLAISSLRLTWARLVSAAVRTVASVLRRG
jgi:hypothetical protein